VRGPKLALSWARDQIATPSKDWTRLCLQFVRMSYGLPALYPDAGTAWDQAKLRHETQDAGSIPAGVPVFWELGSVADHVAISAGAGLCVSTDARRKGKPDLVAIDSITREWGGRLLGWTEDLNGHTVWKKTPVANRVRSSRNKLREARKLVREASQLLDDAPESRQVVHQVGDSLDDVIRHITRKLERLPKQ
jgi:hypothetical protein